MHSFAVFVLRRAKRARAAGRCADPAAGFSAPPPAWMVFCRKQRKKLQKKAPLPGADSPYQGEMSRRDKRGRDAVSRRLTERLLQICIEKPKPQIQFAVWKGRNEHRGKQTSLAAARSVVVVSDAPPAAPSFPSCRKRRGRKGALGRVWCVLPLNSGRSQCFGLAFHSMVTLRMSWYAPPDTGVSDL